MHLFRPVKGEKGKDWRLTQPWGTDFLLNGKLYYKSMGFVGHMGLDYAGPTPGIGVPVYAAHDGVVVVAGQEKGWGLHIRLDGWDFQTNYAHLAKIFVKPGEQVKAMQEIGFMGNTGGSTAVHLHFWLRPRNFDVNNGYKGYIDPTEFIHDWTEKNPTLAYWETIPHFFEDYTDQKPATVADIKRLIDMALARAGINKIS